MSAGGAGPTIEPIPHSGREATEIGRFKTPKITNLVYFGLLVQDAGEPYSTMDHYLSDSW